MSASKNLVCRNKDAAVWHTSWYMTERSLSYLCRGRLEVLTVFIRLLWFAWSALLSHHRDDLLRLETLIVLLYKIWDRPSIMFRQTECYYRAFVTLFTILALAPIMWLWLCERIVRSVWCFLCLHLLLCRTACTSFDCITTLGCRHCVVGYEWTVYWCWVRGTQCH